MLLGNKIRSLRDEQGILQRQVAAYLEIKEMLTLWLADKILDALEDEDELNLNAIKIAEMEINNERNEQH